MTISRRTLMGATMAGVATMTQAGFAGAADAPKVNRIDTHHHVLPPVYMAAVGTSALAAMMPNRVAPTWSPEASLAMMETNGVGEAILSVSSGPTIPDAPILLRKCNDYVAGLRAKHPGRFGSFASLPLPDVEASLKEIAYSLDTLKADGVILFTSYDGKYLGDPLFAPVLAELNRRKAVAFIHPNHPSYTLPGLPPESVLEFPFDTTRTAASLIMSGSTHRYQDVKFILSHAGGTLPFLSQRLAGAVMMNPALKEMVPDVFVEINRFWFDTALSVSKPAMAALMAVADPGRVLFGSDFPMAPQFAVAMSVQGLNSAPLSEPVRAGILRGNAARLLGRA